VAGVVIVMESFVSRHDAYQSLTLWSLHEEARMYTDNLQ
jgi:hypothetical protein